MLISNSRAKREVERLTTQINKLLSKYNADKHTIDSTLMTDDDYELYITLDSCSEAFKELKIES